MIVIKLLKTPAMISIIESKYLLFQSMTTEYEGDFWITYD